MTENNVTGCGLFVSRLMMTIETVGALLSTGLRLSVVGARVSFTVNEGRTVLNNVDIRKLLTSVVN